MLFGRRSGFLSTVAVIATFMSGAVSAQGLRDARPPAEFPPASFTANQYVDSRGCVFVRAGIGGSTEWVPRVSRSREQLCGFQPTQVAGTTRTAPTANVPNPLDTPVAGLTPRAPAAATPAPTTAPTPAPTVAAAPAPAPGVRAPAPTVAAAPTPAPRVNLPTNTSNAINPLTGQRVGAAPRAPIATASPSPRVITTPTPAPTAQPRVLTRAQACAGLTGVQPNLVSQRTGQPIDCGGTTAPRVASVSQPIVQPRTQPVAQATRGRLTREQACADTSRQYVSATTGLPLTCPSSGGNALDRIRADLALPQRPYSNPLDAAPGSTFIGNNRPVATASNQVPYSNPLDSALGSTTFTPGVNTSFAATCGYGGVATSGARCGPQTQSPSGATRTAVVQRPATVTRSRTQQNGVVGAINELVNPTPPPYSNPTRTYALAAPTTPNGYSNVWDDGRLNTQRGIRVGPQTQSPSGLTNSYTPTTRYATAPRAQTAQQPRVSTRVAPQTQPRAEQLSGHRYVQVGTYATRDQAQSIAQALRSRGLPMRIGVFNQNGQEMRIVLAGPFNSDNQLQSALGTARGAGFSGAFTRR